MGSGTSRLPPALVWVSLINEAQLGHGLSELGKMGSDPTGDKAEHTLTVETSIIDSIYQSPSEFDSKGGREVYMVEERRGTPK
jgi:hypothetical protein